MLVLSRKENEWIRIADNIDVGIVEIRGNHVRLAIRAPKEIPVLRHEVQKRIDRSESAQPEVHESHAA